VPFKCTDCNNNINTVSDKSVAGLSADNINSLLCHSNVLTVITILTLDLKFQVICLNKTYVLQILTKQNFVILQLRIITKLK
jgi:hypothetical protein